MIDDRGFDLAIDGASLEGCSGWLIDKPYRPPLMYCGWCLVRAFLISYSCSSSFRDTAFFEFAFPNSVSKQRQWGKTTRKRV
jgi:hypothetical protein